MKFATNVKICNCGIAGTEFNNSETPRLWGFFFWGGNLTIRQTNLEGLQLVIFDAI